MISLKHFPLALLTSVCFLWVACDAPPEVGGQASAGADIENSDEPVEPVEWETDYERALAMAAEQDKRVLINFTGSDWCPPCIRLKDEVFEDQVFHRYAKENLILLELDFPRSVEQPAELKEQNQRLQQEYSIEGFPTLIVLDSEGEEQRRHVGYMPGGPRAFLGWTEG